MKILIAQTTLAASLKKAIRFVSSKPQLPILASFYLEAIDGKLIISATDLHVGIRESIQCNVTLPGTCIVPAKVFLELVSAVKGDVELELKEQVLFVKTQQAGAEIQTFPVTDYPPFPEKDGQQVEFSASLLTRIVDQVGFAASIDETRPILTSVLFLPGQHLKAVSTDGYRLAVLDTEHELQLSQNLLFPAKTLAEIVKSNLAGEKNVSVSISESHKQAFFTLGNTDIVVRTIDGDFPPFEKIIPSSFEIVCEVNVEDFEEHLKTAMIFSRETSGIIQLSLEGDELHLLSNSAGIGKYESKISVKNHTGADIKIAFNGKYLMEFTQRINGAICTIKMNEPLKPAMFECPEDPGFFYVAMPFRLNDN